MNKIIPVVMCGGSGTRLWPLSRKDFPKQFVPILDGKSLLQLTFERLKLINDQILCISSEPHRFLVEDCAQKAQVEIQQILEPVGKNTAAAMALASLYSKPDDLLLFCPSDHFLPDAMAFASVAQNATSLAEQGFFVTFGVRPNYPATAYGYIQKGGQIELESGMGPNGYKVLAFKEKPSLDTAQSFLLEGGFYWNAGIFLVKAQILQTLLAEFANDILVKCRETLQSNIKDGTFIKLDEKIFSECRSESIDYAVLEHAKYVAVVPLDSQWSDVGGWNALADLTAKKDENLNQVSGQGFVFETKNTFIYAPNRPVVGLGIDNILVIDTPDAILVANRDMSEKIKDVVVKLGNQKINQASQHRKVARPWGWYDSIDQGDRFQVKRITVKPGASLSLQLHHHRAEHWIVVKGTARVTNGEKIFLLEENQSTYIPIGIKHRLENPGQVNLEMIEVQSGSYLGEDDIVRFEDTYGRVN